MSMVLVQKNTRWSRNAYRSIQRKRNVARNDRWKDICHLAGRSRRTVILEQVGHWVRVHFFKYR